MARTRAAVFMSVGFLMAVLLTALAPRAANSQVTQLIGASLERQCLRENPAQPVTVDVNCTSERVMLDLEFRGTLMTRSGLVRLVLNSPELDQLLGNRTTGGDPLVPPIEGLSETTLVLEGKDGYVRWPGLFYMMIPDDYAVWERDGGSNAVTVLCQPGPEREVGNCEENIGGARTSTGIAAEPFIIPQDRLEGVAPSGCYELVCGACVIGVPRAGLLRDLDNLSRFWWAGEFVRAISFRRAQIELTFVATVTSSTGEQLASVEVGIQTGSGDNQGADSLIPHIDTNDMDAVTNETFATLPDKPDTSGRVFSSVAFSADRRIRVRLFDISAFGSVAPIDGFVLANDGGEGAQGFHEARFNPRALSFENCAVFTRGGDADMGENITASELTGTAICPVPDKWIHARHNEDQFRIGRDCCNCNGITQETWYGNGLHRERSCWGNFHKCIPGHDKVSADNTRTVFYLRRRMQAFRSSQFCMLCNGDYLCQRCPADDDFCDRDTVLAAEVPRVLPGDYGAGDASGTLGCDWHDVDDEERDRRQQLALLQAPPNLPPQFSNIGLSDMWMYQGDMLGDLPDNTGINTRMVISLEAALAGVIFRQPAIRLEPVDIGEDCSVVVGVSGTVRFKAVNESPFPGTFTATIDFEDNAYSTSDGTNSFGFTIGAAPAEKELNFRISANRANDVPDPEGAAITITVLNQQFMQAAPALTIGCREEDKAFTGPAGEQAQPGGKSDCGLFGFSCWIQTGVYILLVVLAVLLGYYVMRKFVQRSNGVAPKN
jgi:hypothetical protein